jgi:hypothetical protein
MDIGMEEMYVKGTKGELRGGKGGNGALEAQVALRVGG